MAFNLPPAVKLAERLAADIEEAVTRFDRRHRYTFGKELRERAWTVLKTVDAAARDPDRRALLLKRACRGMDELKATMQLGQRLRQFVSFRQFEALFREASKLGQQVGHFRHANAHRLRERMLARRPWLASLTNTRRRFHYSLSGCRVSIRVRP